MRQFKPAIAIMAVLIVIIVGWTLWRQCPGSFVYPDAGAGAGALQSPEANVAAVLKPPARNIDVNAKATHPYLGPCNQCHVTLGADKPVSKVMAGRSISIKQKMTHQYWGNCMLCHTVKDGWQANGQFVAPGEAKHIPTVQAKAAGLTWLTVTSLGLTVQPVSEAMLTQLKLAKENGLLVIAVIPGSFADKTGFRQGDEIVRVNKTAVSRVNQLEVALNQAGAGADLTFAIFRGKDGRKLHAKLPEDLANLAISEMSQQSNIQPILGLPQLMAGFVALAAMGPDLSAPVAAQFETAPYFIIIDQVRGSYRAEVNPHASQPDLGVQTAQSMTNLGVGSILAGGFGQSTLGTLTSLGIAAYPGVTGSVQLAFESYRAGRLSPARGVGHTVGSSGSSLSPVPVPQAGSHNMPQILF